MHVVECAGGVDRYLRMLTSRMDRERFEQILVCSDDFRREEYEDFVDEFVQTANSLGGIDINHLVCHDTIYFVRHLCENVFPSSGHTDAPSSPCKD